MMLTVFDQSQRTSNAYFVPYIWFLADPNRPYRLQQSDRYFLGRRVYEYHQRVQCGRIAYTITGCPVLFFKSEESEMINLINYNIMVHFGSIKFINLGLIAQLSQRPSPT